MWFFSRGKLAFQLEKYSFSPGEHIKGTLTLKLKKPMQANGLFVRVVGEKKIRQNIGGKTSYRTEKIYDFEQPLDGEKLYPGSLLSYPVDIPLPQSLKQAALPDGALGQALKVAQMFAGGSSKISWYVQARLDLPKAIDMRKNVQINVTY